MSAERPSCADFRFNPPEDRLILEYLRPFAVGRITGAESVINDDPYRAEPWELLAEHQRDVEESAFFFARKTMVGTRRSRTVGENGTWRTQTSEKRAVDDGGGRVVAVFRKTLLSYYYLGGNQIMSTGYVMYEYELYVDSHGRGGGTYDSMLCHVKKSCREVARSNKRKREFQAASTGIECNPYPYLYPYSAAAVAASAASAASLSGCRYISAVLRPCEAPVVVDSADGLPESRARNQQSAISLSENSQWRGLPEPACEAPVVVDHTDANRNSKISLSRSPELKASVKSAGEARNFTDRDSATSLPGTPESKAIPEAYAVINRTNANPDSALCLSEPPESAALFESARKSPTVANQLSASSVSELPESRSLHESACEALAVANANYAASQSETKLLESADSSNKSETPYSVGELIDILVTADPAATRIFDHL